MKKLNKKLALTILSLGFAALTPNVASADNFDINFDSCNPCIPCVETCMPDCCPTDSCCSFDFGVDFIYWKPCVDDLDFAANVSGFFSSVDDGTDLNFDYKSVCPKGEPGFRIFLKKQDAWKCFDLSFSYTKLKSDDRESTTADSGEFIAAVGLHPGLATVLGGTLYFDSGSGSWDLDYQVFDILLSYPLCSGSCHTITPFFGVEIAKFDQDFDTSYEFRATPTSALATIAFADWSSNYKGAGLKLGTDYKYELCEGLSLFARASGTILVGHSDSESEQGIYDITVASGVLSNENYLNFYDDDCCHFVPGCHLQLGFVYENDSCGCEYKLRVGYEMVKWFNMQNPRRWFDPQLTVYDGNIAQSIQSNTSTLGFHGLLVGLEVKF